MVLLSGADTALANPSEQTISERVTYYRVSLQDPGLEVPDRHPPKNDPYVNFFWNIEDGPIVVEIPPSADGVGILGALMDAWQRPIDDVGAKGRDKGKRG